MTIEIVSTRALRENFAETVYSAMGDEMIAAGIVPADFLDFRGNRRVCGRSWWGKKKPTRTMFPPGVTHIHLERRASGLCVAGICHEMGKPPYVPPDQAWPQPAAESQRQPLQAVEKGRVVKVAAPRGKVVRPDPAFWQRKSDKS